MKEAGFDTKAAFIKRLRYLNLYNNKHIPERYLYAPIEDRLALLQGLMDTDGTIDKRNGNCSFAQSNYDFCLQFQKLLASLGIKSSIAEKKMHYIKQDGTLAKAWEVFFSTSKEMPCFKLQRKYQYLPDTLADKYYQKAIVNVTKTGRKIPMRCITVSNHSGLFLCGNNYTVTHNSYLVTPFMMARALLLPNTNTYIMAPSGGQAQGTFTKLEDLAKGNIASVIGVSSVFLDECVRMNSTADPFTHAKQSYSVELYNGSTINTLNSVIKNIVGIRSNFSEKTLTFIEIC
nr:MAG TPA: Terminase large subunit [Siphoviridae sp. ctngg6]